jgi:peptidoglycan hydrolase-like protein with peptidoglycan-binding domain
MSQRHLQVIAIAISLVAAIGCSAGTGESGPEAESVSTAALQLGASGPAVRAVRDRLTQFGYFPNATLAKQFPTWHPAVPVTSTQPDLFDDNLELAVRKFQINYGLKPNGTVDTATSDALAQPRCGNPDSDPTLDPTDKFDIVGAAKWNKATLYYKFTNGTAPQQKPFDAAVNQWNASAHRWFKPWMTGTPDITVTFCTVSGCLGLPTVGNTIAQFTPAGVMTSVAIYIDPFASNQTAIMAHEAGHALGPGHSTDINALMFPITGVSAPALDDQVAARSLYMGWTQLPGGALDIGAGGGTRDMWVIGRDTDSMGNGGIYYYDYGISNWRKTSYGAATRIAVDDGGRPWVVNASGQVFRLNIANDVWEGPLGSVLATDIGVSGGGSNPFAYIIGRDQVGTGGDHSIYQWNESTQNWLSPIGGGAVRIAVDSSRTPWIINSAMNIFRWNNDTGWWVQMPGGGTDIGTNQGIVFVIGGDTVTGGNHSVFVWDCQSNSNYGTTSSAPRGCLPLVTDGSGDPRSFATWVPVQGGGTQVAVNWQGRALVVNNAGQIFMQN